MIIVDSHCHLDHPNLEKLDQLDNIINRAKQNNVTTLLTIATKPSTWNTAKDISEKYPNVYFAIGIHPHYADQHHNTSVDDIINAAQHPKAIGIGETGLDDFRQNSSHENQVASFRKHITAATETNLPLIIHTRSNPKANQTEEKTTELLSQAKHPNLKPLLHCFSASKHLAQTAIKLNGYASFSGIITFPSATNEQNVAKILPQDRILIETDAPFLAPTPLRGKINQPANLIHTLNQLAKIRKQSTKKMAQITTQNFFTLFSKAKIKNHLT